MRKNYGVVVGLFVLVMLGVLVVPAGAASSPPIRVKWVLNMDFENGVINATRSNSLYVGSQLRLQWTDSAPTIDCFPVGNVTVGVDSAVFNGGHIQCDLGSLQLSTWTATGGRALLTDTCNLATNQFDMWGRMNVQNPDFTVANSLPLVWHPDYSMSYHLQEDSAGQGVLSLASGVDRVTESAPFTLLPDVSQSVASRLYPCNGSNCLGKHFVDGQLLNQESVMDEVFLFGTTLDTTMYIGYDGVTTYVGELSDIDFDPGCVATTG